MLKVHEEDGLPKYSCTKCAKEVQMALMVKKRIIKAHQLFLDALKKKRVIYQRIVITPIVTKVESSVPKKTKTTKQKAVSKKSKPIIKQNKIQTKSKLVENSNDRKYISTEGREKTNQPNPQKEENEIQKRIESTGFTCEICNLSFSDKPAFNLHSLKHKKSQCHICDRFIRTDNIKKHITLHTAGPSVCSICGATFKNFNCLRCHIFHYHKHTAQQYICEECGKGFRRKHSFLLHKKKVHMGLRNFKCSTCGKAFFTNTTLIKHVRMTHEKLRPYVCEYCSTGFSSKYALKTHRRQHTNEKPFVCYYCSEGFKQRVSLRSHLKSKHGIEEAKEFFCKTCEKGFATSYALSIHERLHETKKCEICSESFAVDEYLTNHLREVHQVEAETKQDS
ncbi:unnamed protein product [Diabrotica balteata]|uniref:C2H2-type domain-containing protein n=1 Tax=Diabrotica balteata TaxID=107213 RepID=A0A9N9XEZ3_DIABA|nr:unnamed protein product [Diabrotica balteata]